MLPHHPWHRLWRVGFPATEFHGFRPLLLVPEPVHPLMGPERCMAKAWICSDLQPSLLLVLHTRIYQGADEELLPSSSSVSIPTTNPQENFAGRGAFHSDHLVKRARWAGLHGLGDKGGGKLLGQRRLLQPHSVPEATWMHPVSPLSQAAPSCCNAENSPPCLTALHWVAGRRAGLDLHWDRCVPGFPGRSCGPRG